YRNVSDNTLELITKARDLLDKDLKEKRKKYREFREDSPLVIEVPSKDGTTPTQTRLTELDSRRMALDLRTKEIEDRLRAIHNAPSPAKAGEVVQALMAAPAEKPGPPGGATSLRAELAPLLLEEQNLLENFGIDHPHVKAVRRKIEMTRELYTGAGEDD